MSKYFIQTMFEQQASWRILIGFPMMILVFEKKKYTPSVRKKNSPYHQFSYTFMNNKY